MLLVPHEPDGTSDSPVPMARPSPAPGQHLKVLLVAEETLVRRALARVVDSCVGGAEVTEAGGTAEAVDILRRTPHDVALADVGRPPREGIQLLQEIRSTWPDLPVILLSAYDDGESVRAALAAGASGYVLKDAAPEDLAQAVRVAQSGSGNMPAAAPASSSSRPWADSRSQLWSMRTSSAPGSPQSRPAAMASPISRSASANRPREADVVGFLAGGATNRQISRRLFLSEKTVKAHLASAFRKLGVQNRTQAAVTALAMGIGAPL